MLQDGTRFWKLPECYIRGNSIKYLRIPDEIIDLVSEEEQRDRKYSFVHYFFVS
jgi:U6 snRNA-associated Sm-like protein LSm4